MEPEASLKARGNQLVDLMVMGLVEKAEVICDRQY